MKQAQYGCLVDFIDVTKFMNDPKPSIIHVHNDTFKSDPKPGHTKFLTVEWENGDKNYFAEGAKIPSSFFALSHGDLPEMKTNPLPVTFIIPSIGRKSLQNTIKSLVAMQSSQWKAILVMDGHPWSDDLPSNVKKYELAKTGFRNCGGDVRNFGLKQCDADTKWVAFVDDDDVVTPDYMLRLQHEILSHCHADVILFRMLQTNEVKPPSPVVAHSQVGISFAMKYDLFSKMSFAFRPSPSEDFDLLFQILKAGKNIHVSDFITYLVRPPFS